MAKKSVNIVCERPLSMLIRRTCKKDNKETKQDLNIDKYDSSI